MTTESTSLTGLPQKKITTGLKRLQEAGITPARWLKMLDAQPADLQRLVASWPGAEPIRGTTGNVYHAGAVSLILGLQCECNDSPPDADDGEIVVYYGGWDLKQLRLTKAGINQMWQNQNWYDDKGWKAEPGYYRLNLRTPDSNHKNWNEQTVHLRTIDEAAQAAPVTVAATALLVHLRWNGQDLLKNDWCRCAEPLPGDGRAVLTVHDGRVRVDNSNWDDDRGGNIWLASSRLVASRKS